MIILDFHWYGYIHVMILYVYELACSCCKKVSSLSSFRELCDSAIKEMIDDKFLDETDSDSDVSM